MSDDERSRSDALLIAQFLRLPQLKSCDSILLYYGIAPEPDTKQLLEPLQAMGKQVFLPVCLPNRQMEARQYCGSTRLSPGSFHIPEPCEGCPSVKPNDLSLILVPALCCDSHGYRLGHGGGYYDRYLSSYSGLSVALCRDALLTPSLPVEPHDKPVDLILTETRCLSFFPEKRSGAAPRFSCRRSVSAAAVVTATAASTAIVAATATVVAAPAAATAADQDDDDQDDPAATAAPTIVPTAHKNFTSFII